MWLNEWFNNPKCKPRNATIQGIKDIIEKQALKNEEVNLTYLMRHATEKEEVWSDNAGIQLQMYFALAQAWSATVLMERAKYLKLSTEEMHARIRGIAFETAVLLTGKLTDEKDLNPRYLDRKPVW